MASMELGKAMMEKWGWSKGQGLGKDNKGMTSVLVLRKNDGSANQGRIEMSEGPKIEDAKAFAKASSPAHQAPSADPALLAAFYASVGLAPPAADSTEPANKRMKTEEGTGPSDDPDALIAKYGAPKAETPSATIQDWAPRERKKVYRFPRQADDWRWSKGTEALRIFEELQLPPQLLTLAQKVLGEKSRFPARIADMTDCILQFTAWGTIILRPRGTGADIALAKRMLFQVMHPSQGELREDVMIEADEEAEAAINDPTKLLDGLEGEGADRVKNALERNTQHKRRNVGIGAEAVATLEEAEPVKKLEKRELPLATSDDIALVQSHISDLRIATGINAMIHGTKLVMVGKERALDRAEMLIMTLTVTGEWVALSDTFVPSEETKRQRKGDDGPVEQILIKVPEGRATQIIAKHLKAMERAAHAQQLKLSSKAIGGKRTLMVEGTRGAHERVKLMAKELADKGESPMLTKHLASTRYLKTEVKEQVKEEVKGEVKVEVKNEIKIEVKEEPVDSAGNHTPGVISAAPVLNLLPEPINVDTVLLEDEAAKILEEAAELIEDTRTCGPTASNDRMAMAKAPPARPAMRMMPAPRLAQDMAAGVDLFAGLPKPEATTVIKDDATAVPAVPAVPPADSAKSETSVFPPLPPSGSLPAASGASELPPVPAFPPIPDMPGGQPKSGGAEMPAFPPIPDMPGFPPLLPGPAQTTKSAPVMAMEAAEQELLDFIDGVTE